MLDLDSGPVHLSYSPGAGSTTLCLSIASSTLISGNRVIWLTREVPDSKRAQQILGDLSESELDRLTIIHIESDLHSTGPSIRSLLGNMQSNDLVIVEDWCERSGKAPKEEISAMIEIITNSRRGMCGVVFTSTSYGDPTGLSERKCRSERSFSEIARTAFLSRKEGGDEIRVLEDDGILSDLFISEKGFFPV